MFYDVVIIGGGSAGLTAGLYAKRGGLKTLIIESLVAGGQINLTGEVENFPGFLSISGYELTSKMLDQCTAIGVDFIYDEVTEMSLNSEEKVVKTKNETYQTKAVILGMGARPRSMGIANEEKYIGGGLSYCAHCDGNFFKGKDVVVVGGGNTALTDALYLSNICKTVYLVHRRDEFRGNKILSDKLKDKSNIILKLNAVPKAIIGENKIEGFTITNNITSQDEDLTIEGLFVAVGTIPNNNLIKESVMLSESGFIITNENMETNVNLVYGAGDIRAKPLRQVVTACSDGATAAADIIGKVI